MSRNTTIGSLVLLAMLSGRGGAAEPPQAMWDEARAAYDAGRPAEARAFYEDLLARHGDTAEGWFNLGNACHRMGDPGHAALSYRRAARLKPRDPDIRANATLVQRLAGAPAPLERRLTFLRYFSATEWLWIGWAGYVSGFLLLGILAFARDFRRTGRFLCLMCAALVAASAAGWGAWKQVDLDGESVVIERAGVDAHFAPLPDAAVHFHLPVASIVRELDRKGDWRLVRIEGATGWIPARAVRPVSRPEGREE